MTDRELIDACLRGERAAWCALVSAHERRMLLVLLRAGATPEEAADLRQEAWARVLARDGAALRRLRLEHAGALGAFLGRVALNVARDAGRARPVARAVPGGEADSVADPAQPADGALSDEQRRRQVARALEQVAVGPNRGRDLVILRGHFQDELTAAEIAQLGIGLSQKGVESVLARARKRLEDLLRGAAAAEAPPLPGAPQTHAPEAPKK